MDEQTARMVEQRYLAREEGLKKCVKIYGRLRAAKKEKDIENEQLYNEHLIKGLMQERQDIETAKLSMDAALHETSVMQRTMQDMNNQIQSTQCQISDLYGTLKHERGLKAEREEYAALAMQIHALPTQADTKRQVAELAEEQERLQAQKLELTALLQNKTKEFGLFFHALAQLQPEMEVDDNAEEVEEGMVIMDGSQMDTSPN